MVSTLSFGSTKRTEAAPYTAGRSGVETEAAASGAKYCGTSGGTIGRAPDALAGDPEPAGTWVESVGAGAAAGRPGEAAGPALLRGAAAVSFLISSRPSGPRRYDNAQRD